MVEAGENPASVVYRRTDGCVYFLGLKEDRLLWKECGYQYMGPMPFIRKRMEHAEEVGVRELSIPWYLLTDVEKELRVASGD